MVWLTTESTRTATLCPYTALMRSCVSRIDNDAHGKLRFRKEFSLYRDGAYPISFQHVGMFFPKTVRMNAVDGGTAREVLYDPGYFTVGADHVAAGLAQQPSAFAGFWVHEIVRASRSERVGQYV